MSLSIVILCSDGPHHGFLAKALSERFDVTGIFCEPEVAQCRRLRHRKRYQDYIWRSYHNARRSFLGLSKYRQAYFGGSFDEHTHDMRNISIVDNVNDPAVAAHVSNVKPDVIVVIGTGIIGKRLLSLGRPIVNIHGGYLPDYKGNHCFFFAYLEGDYDKVGSTIHLIDRGVDTGSIIEQVPVSVDPGDVPETSYCKAEKRAIGRLIETLEAFEETGVFDTTAQPDSGAVFRTRDRKLSHEWRLWRRLGRLRPADYDKVVGKRPSKPTPIRNRGRHWL